MKFNNLRAFEKHLVSASPDHLCQIYFILGKDDYECRSAFSKLQAYFSKGQRENEFGIRIFEAERLSIAELMGELNSAALFAKKRLIHLQNADKLEKSATQRLEAYFEKPNSSICLAISAASINHNTNFYKKGEKAGIVLEFVEEKPWEKERSIHSWIMEFLAREGKCIAMSASQRLVKLLGVQQAVLHNELQKLICYVGDRKEIQLEDIAAITSSIAVDTVWQLGEAIFRRDVAAALKISKAILLDGVPLIQLLRQLRSQFQTGLQVSSLLAVAGTAADITEQFPYMRGAILDRHIAMAQGYGLKSYQLGLLKIDEAELQSKSSSVDPELIAELVIIKLTLRAWEGHLG